MNLKEVAAKATVRIVAVPIGVAETAGRPADLAGERQTGPATSGATKPTVLRPGRKGRQEATERPRVPKKIATRLDSPATVTQAGMAGTLHPEGGTTATARLKKEQGG